MVGVVNKKILIIEDDMLVGKSIESYFKKKGIDVEWLNDGRKALERIKEERFNLIISDVRMPEVSGIEVIRMIRGIEGYSKEEVPVIFISGYADVEKSVLEDIGIDEILDKPFDAEELSKIVDRIFECRYKERYKLKLEVNIPVKLYGRDFEVKGRCVELRDRGIGVVIEESIGVGEVVDVQIEGGKRYGDVKVKGRIVSREEGKDYRYSIDWLEREDTVKDFLDKLTKDYASIDDGFKELVIDFRNFLEDLKRRCDEVEKELKDEKNFLNECMKKVFSSFDEYWEKMWERIINFYYTDKLPLYKTYVQAILGPLLLDGITTNNHVYRKPLGYSGDYIMMNYIYDFHGEKQFLGSCLYEKLVNNYTCNIPISRSNIIRKDYLKRVLEEVINHQDRSVILSVACGPAREVIEILKEKIIKRPVKFRLLDFEKRALEYVKGCIEGLDRDLLRDVEIEYICRDITSIIKDKEFKDRLYGCDLVYVFGLYDYLGRRMAKRLTEELFDLVNDGGLLLICNISKKRATHRAYYEILGEWNMVYRDEEEMLEWVRDLKHKGFNFEYPSEDCQYNFLKIHK